MNNWYIIGSINRINSPALALYSDHISGDIKLIERITGDTNQLHLYVKTNEAAKVSHMLLNTEIWKFKCITIAEAEILGHMSAPGVLLAYQSVGSKASCLLSLIEVYPAIHYSCLVDQAENARAISALCEAGDITLDVLIDLNTGMNRTGVLPERTEALVDAILPLKSLQIIRLCGYDGHMHDVELSVRCQDAGAVYTLTGRVFWEISRELICPPVKVMGGIPTFPIYTKRKDCEYSPGTFVFWNWEYRNAHPDVPFKVIALLITRAISVLDEHHVYVGLGYKAIASESPLPRVFSLNHPEAKPTSQSEEHLILKAPDSRFCPLGSVFYGIPVHIRPTVAPYGRAYVIRDREAIGEWSIIIYPCRVTYQR